MISGTNDKVIPVGACAANDVNWKWTGNVWQCFCLQCVELNNIITCNEYEMDYYGPYIEKSILEDAIPWDVDDTDNYD